MGETRGLGRETCLGVSIRNEENRGDAAVFSGWTSIETTSLSLGSDWSASASARTGESWGMTREPDAARVFPGVWFRPEITDRAGEATEAEMETVFRFFRTGSEASAVATSERALPMSGPMEGGVASENCRAVDDRPAGNGVAGEASSDGRRSTTGDAPRPPGVLGDASSDSSAIRRRRGTPAAPCRPVRVSIARVLLESPFSTSWSPGEDVRASARVANGVPNVGDTGDTPAASRPPSSVTCSAPVGGASSGVANDEIRPGVPDRERMMDGDINDVCAKFRVLAPSSSSSSSSSSSLSPLPPSTSISATKEGANLVPSSL